MEVDKEGSGAGAVAKKEVSPGVQGVNSIGQQNLGQVFGQVFGPKLRPVLPRGRGRPPPADLPFFNLTSRANFRAKIYVD